MGKFNLKSSYKPKGDQPKAIRKLVKGPEKQVLLGVTGSGKTFTMANVIASLDRPTLLMAHNKTLAFQLYNELKDYFPDNAVEFFISYYDYYQPESYIPSTDTYIEKDSSINPRIEQMRLSATNSLLTRRDVIVVSSVSCIYSLGNPNKYKEMSFELYCGQKIDRKDLLLQLVSMLYQRNDTDLQPGTFRVRGDVIDIMPGYSQSVIRIEMWGPEIDRISILDKMNLSLQHEVQKYFMFPAKHFVIPEDEMSKAIHSIRKELYKELPELDMMLAHRLKSKTLYDIEMMEETGHCKSIENYSRHFDGRKAGEAPYTLLDYFPKDFLFLIDESHQTIPQVNGMYKGDRSRKENLVKYGFRLPSALDNRPLRFAEFEHYLKKVIFVSATPGHYELKHASQVVEQIIRPTGLLDPEIEVRKTEGQMDDLIAEIRKVKKIGYRVLVTTLTKRLAEELTSYLSGKGIKVTYMHSEIDAIERTEIIKRLRLGRHDVLVGINLLREGLDLPEVALVAILDADKEGFLRDERSLIQTIGRAARNAESRVLLYADKVTGSMQRAIDETNRRRSLQQEHNRKNGISPKTIMKAVSKEDAAPIKDRKTEKEIIELEAKMRKCAENLDFEKAIEYRNLIENLR